MAVENIRIRPMQPADLEQVQAIDQISFTIPWSSRAYHYELNDNPGSLLYVAENEAEPGQKFIVGYIVIWLILDEAHIATIAVHPDYRRRGIAQDLIQIALSKAIKKGAHSATLEVRENNKGAQQLYRRFQFVVVGRRKRYYRDNNENAILMTASSLEADYLAWLKSGGWRQPPQQASETAAQ